MAERLASFGVVELFVGRGAGRRAVVTLSLGSRPFVQHTRPLMQAYAVRVRATFHCVDTRDHPAVRSAVTAFVRALSGKVEGVEAPAKETPLKAMVRVLEKALLRPDAPGKVDRICDIVRDMFVANSMGDVAAIVRALRTSRAIVIVRVKDRFTTPSAGGWRDLMINFFFIGRPGMSQKPDASPRPRSHPGRSEPPLSHSHPHTHTHVRA